jgi:hydroxymethylpyrimidine pyrophosphatase-like HAD family hydrolase
VRNVRYVVLAAGFDGTLARDGRCDERSIEALRALAASGRKLVLVTSRQLRDLLDVFPEARLFDYLVLENGAVVHRPVTRESAILAHAPAETLIHELRRRQIGPLAIGSATISTDTNHREAVEEAVRKLRLECEVLQNDRALSILPAGVNKATGVSAVLEELGMSEHNLAAIGDAENDLALFELAEHAVAVSNADATLKRVADRITRAAYADGVIEFANELLDSDLASAPVRRRIIVGTRSSQLEATLWPARCSVLLAGPHASGKAALCNSLLSQYLAQRYQCCVIGAYPTRAADEDGPFVVYGDAQSVPRPAGVLAALEAPGQSVLVNVAAIEPSERAGFIEALLEEIAALQARSGRPHATVIDQADVVLNPAACEILKRFDASMVIYVSAQPAHLSRDLLQGIDVVVALGDAAPTLNCFRQMEAAGQAHAEFAPLELNQALMWMRSSGTAPFRIVIDLRLATCTILPEARPTAVSQTRSRAAQPQSDEAAVP